MLRFPPIHVPEHRTVANLAMEPRDFPEMQGHRHGTWLR